MPEESYWMDLLKMPLLAVTILVISMIGLYFNVPLLIPPFAASLFMIYLREGSEFAHVKNVLGGHLIGFGAGFCAPFLAGYLSFLPDTIAHGITIGAAILAAGWIMAIIRFEHPPAVATTLVFYRIDTGSYHAFDSIPTTEIFSFLIGLAIVSAIALIAFKKK
jgi:CBS-domain-containing membrane protein